MGKASRQKKRELARKSPKDGNATSRPEGLPWWLIALLCLAAFLAFAQTLSFDFVYDDDAQVLRNPWIRDWSKVGNFFFTDVWHFANETTGNYYRPFHMIAHAAAYSFSGLHPWGFHLINVLLHCVNTLLVAFIGYRLTRDRFVSAAGGTLFALHPIHVESVAWIAGITDPLCAVFYFAALYVYLNDDAAKSWKSGLLTSLLFLGALFSKEMAFTLPLALVLMDACLRRKLRWKQYAMLVVAFGIYCAFRINALSQFQIKQVPIDLNLGERFLSSAMLMGQYIAKAFIPFDINAFHVFHPVTDFWDFRLVLSTLAILILALAAWYCRNDRKILFLCCFIPVAVLPVLNISGIGANIFSDRYLYIPSLGSCLTIPLIFLRFSRWKIPRFHIPYIRIAAALVILLGFIYAFMLWKTSFVWRDNLTLYTETLKHSPDSAAMAGNLARLYFDKGQIKEAAHWLSRAQSNLERSFIKNELFLVTNYVQFAAVLLREGKVAEALEYLKKGYRIDPENPAVLQNLGTVCIVNKDYAQARKWFETSLAVNPRNEISYNNLAFLSLQDNQIDKAIEYARKALEIFPRFGDAHLNLARAYAAKGLTALALESYRNAKLYNPLLGAAVDSELHALQSGEKSK